MAIVPLASAAAANVAFGCLDLRSGSGFSCLFSLGFGTGIWDYSTLEIRYFISFVEQDSFFLGV